MAFSDRAKALSESAAERRQRRACAEGFLVFDPVFRACLAIPRDPPIAGKRACRSRRRDMMRLQKTPQIMHLKYFID